MAAAARFREIDQHYFGAHTRLIAQVLEAIRAELPLCDGCRAVLDPLGGELAQVLARIEQAGPQPRSSSRQANE